MTELSTDYAYSIGRDLHTFFKTVTMMRLVVREQSNAVYPRTFYDLPILLETYCTIYGRL